jgi:hypothetical protein
MKKNLLLLLLSSSSCFSQSYFYDNRYYDHFILVEAGASMGSMNCMTDLGGKPGKGKPFFKDINWNCTRPSAGIFAGLLYRYTIGLRLEATFGNVQAADSLLKKNIADAVHRYERNLHFKSRIRELSLVVEFHPLSLLSDPYEFSTRISPYLLAGLGLFSFNPKAFYQGKWISLPPLRTEGQGFPDFPGRLPYKTTQLNFPAGCGLKYELSALFNARLELVYRFLLTDYLDDVSQRYIDPDLFYHYHDPAKATLAAALADRRRPGSTSSARRGNPKNKDSFFSLNLKIGLILNRKRV